MQARVAVGNERGPHALLENRQHLVGRGSVAWDDDETMRLIQDRGIEPEKKESSQKPL